VNPISNVVSSYLSHAMINRVGWLTGSIKECYGFRGPPFPEKLLAAMDAPRAVIQWTNNGQAITVDAENYERNVMRVHPGLVEISSFANFRRQMREYAFDWQYLVETQEFVFSHPSFVRSRPDLLSGVLTRRKRRRRHGTRVASSAVGTRLQSSAAPTTTPTPRRRSVIAYAGSVKGQNDRAPTCSSTRSPMSDVGTAPAKSLNEMTDDEWWTYCAPAIMSGINGGSLKDESVSDSRPTIATNTFSVPLLFYTDQPAEDYVDEALNNYRSSQDDSWTQRTLDFDEL